MAILTQYYPPELGAPQQRLSELAAHFVARGHTVDVLTAMPSYPKGKVFDGYTGRVAFKEQRDGVDILRSFILPSQSAALAPRLMNYFSFVASSAVVGAAGLRRCDFLMVESPPLFLGLSGIFLAAAKRAKLIFNVSDLWPESAARLDVIPRDGLMYKTAEQLEALCYRAAWLVTGQSRTILDDIERRFPRVRTLHLSNGCDTTKYGRAFASSDARKRLLGGAPESSFVVVYAGLHGLAQGLDQILAVAGRLRDVERARFVLVGDGPEKATLLADARSRGLDNVRFLDPVKASEVPALLASADAIVVPLKTDIPGAVPSKIYEGMGSERPLILVASGEAADIVRNNGAGLTVRPGDIDGLEQAVRSLIEDPALVRRLVRSARATVVEKFDRAGIVTRFIQKLEVEA